MMGNGAEGGGEGERERERKLPCAWLGLNTPWHLTPSEVASGVGVRTWNKAKLT